MNSKLGNRCNINRIDNFRSGVSHGGADNAAPNRGISCQQLRPQRPRVPPILSEKRSTSARTVGRHDGAMDHNTSVQPARLTCSAKQGSSEAVVSSNSRVNFTRTLKKGQHKDATARTRQDSVCSCEGPETDKLQMNGVTHAVPSDVKLSPEVILKYSGETDYAQVYNLNLRASHLQSIQHLDKFVSLQTLDLSGNCIMRIDNLFSNKELLHLRLYDNQITEISGLDSLKELQHLHLQHNRIRTIGRGLQSLNKLKVLRLDFNAITQLSSQHLLCCSQLTSVDLSSNRLTSLAGVNCLPNLEELYATSNRIQRVDCLAKCKKLKEVDLSFNPLTDLSGLRGIHSLKSIIVSHCPVSGFESIGQLNGLEELYASHCHLADLKRTVTRYPALQILDISFNQIDNIEQLQYLKTLPDLVELSFSGNPVCSMLNPGASITDHLHQLLPKLEVIDGISTAAAAAAVAGSIDNDNAGDDENPLISDTATQFMHSRPLTADERSLPLAGDDSRKAPTLSAWSEQAHQTFGKTDSDEISQQLNELELQLSVFQSEFATKFHDVRASFDVLPSESTTARSRPTSRASIKSRLHEARIFASSQIFDNS